MRRSLLLALVLARFATAQEITEFSLPAAEANPWYIASAPDGSVWFTELDGERIGRLTPDGTLTEVPLNETFSKPYGIVVTTDGAVWFGSISRNWIKRIDPQGGIGTLYLSGSTRGLCTDLSGAVFATIPPDRIGKITTDGHVTEYTLPFQSSPAACASDAAGNIWYTAVNTNAVGRLAPNGTAIEYRFATAEQRSHQSIVLGADGNMWFTETNTNRVGRITPSGAITEFNATGSPWTITVGPDRNLLWFVQHDNAFTPNTNEAAIVRLTYAGEMKSYPVSGPPMGVTASGRALWFTLLNPINHIGRLSLPKPIRRRAIRH